MDLKDATEEVKFFEINGEYPGKIIRVVDGDTVCAVIELPYFGLCQFKLRLKGINAPEMKPRLDCPGREEIIRRAHISTNVLREKIEGKIVRINCCGFGNFGRLLAEIYYEDENVNEWMLENGYAEKYVKIKSGKK